MMTRTSFIAAALLVAACGPYPKRIHHEPIISGTDRIAETAPPAAAMPAGAAHAAHAPAPFDGAAEGRSLIRQGDELVAFGKYAEALDRYNRASVLLPKEPIIDFKIGRMLDLQMQPHEAAMRYRKFLHTLELEKISAQGEANASLAEAIAIAQQRLTIIDKR